MQSRPEFVPRLAQTDLAHGKHGIKFLWPDRLHSQCAVGSEIRNSQHSAMILELRITENAVVLQFPKNADYDSRVAASADYHDFIHVFLDLQKSAHDSVWLAIHVPLQKSRELGCLVATQFRHLPDPCSQGFPLIKVVPRR